MGAPNASRIEVLETVYSFTNRRLSDILHEIDSRLNCVEVYETISRTSGLISKIEIFSNSARTIKVVERTITRTAGSDGVNYITGMITIFYNANATEDSRVTTTITRVNNLITSCDNVWTSPEPLEC